MKPHCYVAEGPARHSPRSGLVQRTPAANPTMTSLFRAERHGAGWLSCAVRPHQELMTEKTPGQPSRQWGWLIVGCIVFGILMGARTDFHSGLARDAAAGCAFVVLGVSLSLCRKAKA